MDRPQILCGGTAVHHGASPAFGLAEPSCGLFRDEQQHPLRLGDRVAMRHLQAEADLSAPFTLRFFSGAVAWDLIHQLARHDLAHVHRITAQAE
jgi:hypothetical protein